MYEEFYGLKEKPFTLTPDPKYLFLGRAHREALDHLLYGIQEREGFIVITGDVGTGKTTLCRAILTRFDQGTKTALILNPLLSEEELLRAALHDFGLQGTGTTKKELVDELNRFLLRALTDGQNAVLIVDEAQNLSPMLLEQVRLLSNLETEREKLIQIILVGQLGLLDLLASPELKQLNQRVSVRYQLKPLSYQETCQYIYHRLMVAGGSGGVTITSPALQVIYRFSRGIPRLINLACDRSLLQGFVDHSTHITRSRAQQAIASLSQEVSVGPAGHPRRRVLPLVAAALLVVGFTGGWLVSKSWERAPVSTSTPRGAALPAASRQAAEDHPFTILVANYATEAEAREVERRLSARGYRPFLAVKTGERGERNY
ncbi:MAG: AAA family ATPase, partial [Candidatus Rokubacteria bacterium]|nr:AAA family ATPase [Candidatus Rokubacteria bacterium]